MPRTWLSVRVDLVSGRGEDLWPRPGRIFAAARAMTFGQLAAAIDDAFGRWDLAHLHTVELADALLLIGPGDAWDDPPQGRPVERTDRTKLSRLALGEQFAYTFDLGDDWTHLCTVGDQRIDPYEALGEVPDRPAAFWGWGSLPDQYGRRFDEDDGETPVPPDPCGSDLPPIRYDWGPRPRG